MAELFWVSSAGRTGKSAIAKGGKTGQNYNCILNSRNNYMNTQQNVWYIGSIRKNICQGHKNF
jgi:hypothetical protein